MKRIIGGTTYNTDTATLVARATFAAPSSTTEVAMYQAPSGVFFAVDALTRQHIDRHGQRKEDVGHTWQVIGGVDAAREKCGLWGLSIIQPLQDVSKGSALYIRVPPMIKDAVEIAALEQGVSVNTFVLRLLEKAVVPQAPPLQP